ncbi:PREDICTED: thioredoxin domain-containing protein 17 [Nicrophorus vespilloides]|uniref:Thioredoxin domain-containing protein 17 n=1 Tax=Nicrophorus vespilloides TaxID=110193 RepID=A0ABM1N534_NICVS|nr:PREDICTED: thioredoxin domain-containing protein 17 [Nicrophorus vespilloides]XP_017781933.1 PREDICTED: thioredoxin domain-containing protein 17 [Nicrophorus vespilloides]XP_017781934.1 PREDICTED: thioredoxin domain-containing protein 17 [Nicrophorus vespilloides]
MVIKHQVVGYEQFVEHMKQYTKKDLVYVYYCGSKLPSGESWCIDCVRAWPVIEPKLSLADESAHFVYVECGDRAFWKDMKCPFRKDPSTKLMVLPTLVKWKQPEKLEGDQCEKPDLVEMLFSDD